MARRGKALLICAVAITGAVLYGVYRGAGSPSAVQETGLDAAWADARPTFKRIYFRYNGKDRDFGRLAFIDSAEPNRVAFAGTLSCESEYVAGGRGICLAAERGVVTSYSAKIFDETSFETLSDITLHGVPSRSRVSRDGRVAALTVFVAGHGYASVDFSTQTLLIDTAAGRAIADVESFVVTRDGQALRGNDFNFWGVTFTPDSKGFYATLSTSGRHLLVRGDIESRSAQVIFDDVECPSLSPNGNLVAFKKRRDGGGQVEWQLHVLDLKTMTAAALAERGSIDDQLEWLDDDRVLYAVKDPGASPSTSLWTTTVEGSSKPQMFLRNAYSPAVVR